MAVTHSTAARNAMANAAVDILDTGSANVAGIARFRTSANAVVAGLNLSNPAFGTASGGVAAAAAITPDTSAAGGAIASLTLEDRDRNVVITANDIRTTAGGDLQGHGLSVGIGDTVQILSLSYVAPQ
jgi:hypothetical protein